jgi:thioredoxin-like negative regulator of GroEL
LSQQPLVSAAISHLADLSLPVFEAPHLRGQDGDAKFDAGMKAYASQDCGRAVQLLSQVEAQSDEALAAKFYAGVCQLHEGNLAAASVTLGKVAAARDSAQQEAAIYYLAQIALTREDATSARHYLARTIALHGDFEQRARAELKKIG